MCTPLSPVSVEGVLDDVEAEGEWDVVTAEITKIEWFKTFVLFIIEPNS